MQTDIVDSYLPPEFTKDNTPAKNSNLRILWIFHLSHLVKPPRIPVSLRGIGEVAEWSKATVLKTVDRRRSVGSNPTLSAIMTKAPSGAFFISSASDYKVRARLFAGAP